MNSYSEPKAVVRLRPETYDRLEAMAELTKRPIGSIANEAVNYALDNSHLVVTKSYSIHFGKEEGAGR